jgi:tetratricopeptide (TPR) repeat protein
VYFRQAGEKAIMLSAHREAVGYFEQALGVLSHLPEQRDTREQAIDLRLALRSALNLPGDLGRILVLLREAEAIATVLDDPRRLAQVSLFLSTHFRVMGAYDQAIATAQRALTLTAAGGEVILHVLANQYLGFVYHAQGDYRRAIDLLRQTVTSLGGAQPHERFGRVSLPVILSRAHLAWCHAELGTFVEGQAYDEEGLRIAEVMNHPASIMTASWGAGLLSLRRGDLHRAFPLLERAMALCQEADLLIYFPRIAAALGAAYTLGGRLSDSVPLLTQALEERAVPGSVHYETLCSLPLGEAQMLAGHLEEAHTLAERALALTSQHQERGNQAYALRLLGDIVARREPPENDQAEDYYRQALTLAEELGMHPLVAHCHLGLGTLYGRMGRVEPARAEFTAAIEMYRAMDMTFWLPQAEAALAKVGGC